MKAKELIGKVCTRISPAVLEDGTIDKKYMGEKILIVNANDFMISFKYFNSTFYGEGIRFLSSSFCDDKWENIESFLKETEENASKFSATNE